MDVWDLHDDHHGNTVRQWMTRLHDVDIQDQWDVVMVTWDFHCIDQKTVAIFSMGLDYEQAESYILFECQVTAGKRNQFEYIYSYFLSLFPLFPNKQMKLNFVHIIKWQNNELQSYLRFAIV